MAKKARVVGVGGTFDHFHLGHRKLIDAAAAAADTLMIGITSESFAEQLEKLYPESLQSYFTRLESVKTYCASQKYQSEFFSLSDPYGPTLSADTVDVLCVSSETKKTADQINKKRQEASLRVLPIIEVPLLTLATGEPLSSTLIRQGVVNRVGTLYESALKKTLVLTKEQRAFFGELQGELVEKPMAGNGLQLVVGDSSLQKFLANDWHFDLAVFDYQIGREPYEPPVIAKDKIDLIATNPAGAISTHLTSVLKTALQKKMRNVFVEGEEDLAAVALVLIAPLGTEIYYGQPDVGLVCIQLTEEKKNKIYKILLQ